VTASGQAGGVRTFLQPARAQCLRLSGRFFQSKYDCGRRTDSLKDRQRSNVGGFVVRSQWNRVQLTKHAIWHDDLQAPLAVQVTTCRGRGILLRPHYRPHSLLNKLCGMPPQYAPPPTSRPLTFWPRKWCPCDVGYLCANCSLHRPLHSRVRPDVRNRWTDRQTDRRQTNR